MGKLTSSLDDAALLRIQMNLFNAWIDRVKTLSDDQVDVALHSIPADLWDLDMGRLGFCKCFFLGFVYAWSAWSWSS